MICDPERYVDGKCRFGSCVGAESDDWASAQYVEWEEEEDPDEPCWGAGVAFVGGLLKVAWLCWVLDHRGRVAEMVRVGDGIWG